MPRPFRFAVQALGLSDRDAIVSSARRAEELGYEEFYSYDHLGAEDPFAPLMVAAEATTRLRVGPLVLNNEFHHPALLARTAATVDRLTSGRLVLGFGTGYDQREHDAMNLELRPPRPRVDRLRESVAAVRALLDHGKVEVRGIHHQLAIDDLGIRPAQSHVPILIGGHGRRVIGVAARWADIFQFTGVRHDADGKLRTIGFAAEGITERARWLTESAGDRDGEIERSALVQATHIGAGAAEATDRATERLAMPRDKVEGSPFLLFGSVEHVVDKLEALRAATGISHIVVRDIDGFAPVVAALAER